MDMINAIIPLSVDKLNYPLRPWMARQGHSFVAKFSNVPSDITGLYVRVFKENGAYYDLTGVEHRDGTWTVRVKGVCFPTVGEYKYEVHAKGCDDEPVALGEGLLCVQAFSTTNEGLEVGTTQAITEMPCEGGGTVQTMMVWDGFEWVLSAVHNEETL